MAKPNTNELTMEQIEKAMACETAEELMELAKAEGFDITKKEAEAYMAEMEDIELDEEVLSKAAGGYGGRPREVRQPPGGLAGTIVQIGGHIASMIKGIVQ